MLTLAVNSNSMPCLTDICIAKPMYMTQDCYLFCYYFTVKIKIKKVHPSCCYFPLFLLFSRFLISVENKSVARHGG